MGGCLPVAVIIYHLFTHQSPSTQTYSKLATPSTFADLLIHYLAFSPSLLTTSDCETHFYLVLYLTLVNWFISVSQQHLSSHSHRMCKAAGSAPISPRLAAPPINQSWMGHDVNRSNYDQGQYLYTQVVSSGGGFQLAMGTCTM